MKKTQVWVLIGTYEDQKLLDWIVDQQLEDGKKIMIKEEQ